MHKEEERMENKDEGVKNQELDVRDKVAREKNAWDNRGNKKKGNNTCLFIRDFTHSFYR